MNDFRKGLVDRMIRIYGFEHEVVVNFTKACETNQFSDNVLEIVVGIHEEKPWI